MGTEAKANGELLRAAEGDAVPPGFRPVRAASSGSKYHESRGEVGKGGSPALTLATPSNRYGASISCTCSVPLKGGIVSEYLDTMRGVVNLPPSIWNRPRNERAQSLGAVREMSVSGLRP